MTETKENYVSFMARVSSLSQEDQWMIHKAYQLSKRAHDKQVRDDGSRYFDHPRAVALIMMDEFKLYNPNLIIGALLHDVGEDAYIFGYPKMQRYSEWKRQATFLLTKEYNPHVAEIVVAVTIPHVDGIEVVTEQQAHEMGLENLRGGSDEARITKMGDRLHNLRCLIDSPKKEKRIRKARETVTEYYPIFDLARKNYPQVVSYAKSEMDAAIARLSIG